MAYWVKFEKRAPACVEAVEGETVEQTAARIANDKVVSVQSLPYPAEPRLNRMSTCPSFCMQPEKCAGRGSCPRFYACND